MTTSPAPLKLRAPIVATQADVDAMKGIPLEQRSVTQLVIGLELMLSNLRTTKLSESMHELVGENYVKHLEQLRTRGYEKMHRFYEVELRAYRLRHL